MIKFCDHVKYDEGNKTYYIKETINMFEGESKCSKCGVNVDLKPLKDGGQTLILDN